MAFVFSYDLIIIVCFSLLTNVTFFRLQALSGVGAFFEGVASVTNNSALDAALNTQFLFQIGVFTAVPMVLGFILEQGFLRVSCVI